MTLLDALRSAMQQSRGPWLRPVGWRGHALAVGVDGHLLHVPAMASGYEPERRLSVGELLGDWECVSPDVVLSEPVP